MTPVTAPELPEDYWHCSFRSGCKDGKHFCDWPCDKWAKQHDADTRNELLDILDLECQEIQSRIESSAMGSPLSERERGRIIGMLDVRVKIKSLYTKEKK